MATKPAGAPVKELDLRSINNALNMIREQLFQIALVAEQAQKVAGQTAFSTGQGASGVALLGQQISALQAAIVALQAGSLAPTATYRADAEITSYDTVFPTSDGGVSPVDTQDPTQIFAAFAIATSNATIGQNLVVRRSGVLTEVGIGLEPGRAIYAQVGGGLTQLPNYAAFAIPVGVAINSTDMEVRCAWPALVQIPLYQSSYEDFMPVTMALVRATLELVESIVGQPDGFVVKIGDVLTTRALIAGSGAGITIVNPDGVDGDPLFSVP